MNIVGKLGSAKTMLSAATIVAVSLVGRMSYAQCGELPAGASLTRGQTLYSCDGTLGLTLETSGNLVLEQAGIGLLWQTGTTTGYELTMQATDGNLVLYNASHQALYPTCTDSFLENDQYGAPRCIPSNTTGHPGAYLSMQTDGNVVVYPPSGSALWATNTSATATPPYMLEGSANYVVANPYCEDLTFVEVVIDITETLVSEPSKVQPSCNGFSFQINANSPPSNTAFVWQQFIFGLDNPGTQINGGAVNDWTEADFSSGNAWGPGPTNLATLATPYTIPAGYQFALIIGTTNGIVTSADWSVTDQYGNLHYVDENLSALNPPAGALAPINAFQVDLVGPGDGCLATFSSGAGTISYYVTQATSAESSIPSCAADDTTGEQSNILYGGLPKYPNQAFVQQFKF